MADRAPVSRRGRPRLIAVQERRELLLAAAERVFVETGYADANMDEIARRAGMSKKTIYSLFENKEALFSAVVEARKAELAKIAAMDDDISDTRRPDIVLRAFLIAIARFILAPRQAALHRLVIAEVHRTPELARAFHQDCPGKQCNFLEDWIARQNARGVLDVDDPAAAASMLFSMVVGEPQMQAFMREGREPDLTVIERRVDYAVRLFLEGARRRAPRTRRKKQKSAAG